MKKLVQIFILLHIVFPIAGYCGDWELMDNPFSNTDAVFTSIWGSSSNDVYVVGEYWTQGIILHFNGKQWTIQGVPKKIAGVWGSSKHNIYVGGTDIIGQSRGLDYWFFRPQMDLSTYCFVTLVGGIRNNMLMIGNCYDKGLSARAGFIIRYSRIWGARMIDVPNEVHSGFNGAVKDVWTYNNIAYFVAEELGMLKYNGISISSVPVDTKGINALWGSDIGNIFLVGRTGKIVRCNIKATPPIIITYNPITDIDLFDVWGSSPNDVYAVGWYGMIFHFDGNTWSQMDSGVGSDLLGVWGKSGGDVFAVGYQGTILRKKAP